MKLADFFWGRIGFTAVGVVVGALYGVVLTPLLLLCFPALKFALLMKVFCTLFALAGLFGGERIVDISTGAFYFVWGALFGLALGEGAANGPIPGGRDRGRKQGSRPFVVFFVLGMVAALVAVVLHHVF